MKKIAYIISILFLMGLGSCYKDLGNYTYGDKPGIGIDSVLAEYDKYVVIDTLCITPRVEGMDQIVRYEWSVYNQALAVSDEIVLDSVKDLRYPVALPQGNYTLLFRVTDETGYTETLESFLKVKSAYSEGWYVLKELEGGTELDLYAPGLAPGYDLLDKLYGRRLEGKPVGLSIFPTHNYHDTIDNQVSNDFVMFPISEKESPMLRVADMYWRYDFDDMLYDGRQDNETPLKFVCGGKAFAGMVTDKHVRCNNNMVAGGAGKWGAPALVPSDEIRPSKYVAYSTTYSYVTMLYDNLNGAFLNMNNFGSSADRYKSTYKDKVSVKPFDLPCQMIYMKQTSKSNVAYAVLEHKENRERYVFTLNTEESKNQNPIVAIDSLDAGLKINEAFEFTLNGNLPYLYYSIGNECYLYDISLQREEKVDLAFANSLTANDGSEEITLLEHIYWNDTDPWEYFVVATYANGRYKLYLYPIHGGRPDVTGNVVMYEGEGKVAAIHYVMPEMKLGLVNTTYYPYN